MSLAVLGYGSSWALTQAFPSADPAAASSSSGSGQATDTSDPSTVDGPGLVAGRDADVSGSTCQRWSGDSLYCVADDSPNAFNPDGTQGQQSDDGETTGGWLDTVTADQLLGAQAHSATTFEVLGSGGVALAVLGSCLWLADALARRRAARLVAPLVAVGSMPLTAYSVHVVALAFTSHDAYSGAGDPGWLAGSWQLWVVFAGTALVVCTLWVQFLGRGPLERLITWTVRRAARA